MSVLEGMCIVNACAFLFTHCNFETKKRIFIKIDFISYFAMVHLQSSRRDAEHLPSPPSTQLYHCPWTVPTLKVGTPVWHHARSTLSATGWMAKCYQPEGTTGLVQTTPLSHHRKKKKTSPSIVSQYILKPVWTGMTTYYDVGGVPMYGERKLCTTSCGQSSYSEAKMGYDRFLPIRTSSLLIIVDPPHPTLKYVV